MGRGAQAPAAPVALRESLEDATTQQLSDVIELAGTSVRVASLEDLLAMKRAAGRPQDAIDIESLELARSRLRGRRAGPGT